MDGGRRKENPRSNDASVTYALKALADCGLEIYRQVEGTCTSGDAENGLWPKHRAGQSGFGDEARLMKILFEEEREPKFE